MIRPRLLLALGAVLLPAALGAQAPAPAPPAAAAAAELATRFDPPLDKVLRYRLTQEKVRDGAVEQSTMDQEITYSRSGDHVVMTVRPVRIGSAKGSIDLTDPKAPVPPTLKPLLAPLSFELDADGAIVRMHNWEGYKRDLNASIPVIAASAEPDPAKRPQAEAFMRDFFGKYLSASAEDAPRLVIKGWPDLLELMGVSAPAGESVETSSVAQSPLFPQPLTYKVSMRLTVPPGSGLLHIEVTSVPDPVQLRQAVTGLIEGMMKAAPGGQADRATLERELGGMDLASTMVVDLDARSGLVRKAVMTKNMKMGGKSGMERITIEAQ